MFPKKFFVPYMKRIRTTEDERVGIYSGVVGRPSLELTSEQSLPEALAAKYGLRLMVAREGESYVYYGSGQLADDLVVELLAASIKLQCRITQVIQRMYGPPAGDFRYEYPDIQLICGNCQKPLKRSELGVESVDDDYELRNICPHCHEPNCVELVYEL